MKNSKVVTPLMAIRAYCFCCMGAEIEFVDQLCKGGSEDVWHCDNKHCPLYPYRFGNKSRRKRFQGYSFK
ncbi:hypothetical protein ACFL2G_05325 [Candidatus Omnitrophota bacterium]